ncbi:sodium/proline symporter [hydrocarbon metagenome]|uniref:Sodium/proline symporter n=1 Tax=hydrocarbon metagenome TaxID=938273 RepID=A0A0W8E3C1_9ZZZZ
MLFAKIAMMLSFFAVIIGLSLYTRKKTNTVDDFVVGNRSVGPWMSAFSYGTAYFSAVLLIGFAGKVGWGYGMSALLIALGNSIIGTYLAWRILGRKTREMTSRLNVLTMPSFLEKRYDSSSMKIVSSLIIFIFFVPYAASVFMGLSYLFEQTFGIPYVLALTIMALLAGLYLVLGGYMAVALVDFVQGLIMIAGVVLMVYFVVGHEVVNGFANGFASLRTIDPELIMPSSAVNWVGLISLIILTSLGTWGLPQMVQKFYGIKNEQVIPLATRVSTIFSLIITMGAYYVGSTGHLFFAELPVFNGTATPDLIMPTIIGQTLPPLVGVLILILVLSASMSTLSSLVLTASSSVSIDLVKGTIKKDISEKATMNLMRVLCIAFIAFCLYVALNPPGIILTLMALSWGAVAGSFLAPYIYGLFWPDTTRAGAWAGMLTGLFIAVGGYLVINTSPAFISSDIMELFTKWGTPFFGSLAMIIPLGVVPLVSLITRSYTEEHINRVYNEQESIVA